MGLFTSAISKTNRTEFGTDESSPVIAAPFDSTAHASEMHGAVELESALDVLWAQLLQSESPLNAADGQAYVMAHWESQEGATTLAAALAHRAAELDPASSFCLADFDFTNSGLSFLLGLEAELGISNVLLGQSSLEESLAITRLPNLTVLPAGYPSVGRQVTQLYDRCQELCELLRSRFNYVFLDVPSLGKHPNFAFWAGGRARAVLVVRAGQARRPTVAKAIQILQLMRLEVAGVALNAREFYVPKWLYTRT